MPRPATSANPVAPGLRDHGAGLSTAPALPALPRGTQDRLEAFVALVEKWTASINLISVGDRRSIWPRHVEDSLRLLPLIPPGAGRAVDLGSGAGFPGLVLALVSGIPFDLIESDRRKAAFLVEAQRVTSAPVQVHCMRIEDATMPRTPLVTARALAPLTALLAFAHARLVPGGTALLPKGLRVDEELAEAHRHWRMRVRRIDDPRRPGSTILAISDLTHA